MKTKEQTVSEFLEILYNSNHNRISGDTGICSLFGEKSAFRIICAKCGGTEIEIVGELGTDYGGETGYSAGSTVVKCLKCGAATTVYQ